MFCCQNSLIRIQNDNWNFLHFQFGNPVISTLFKTLTKFWKFSTFFSFMSCRLLYRFCFSTIRLFPFLYIIYPRYLKSPTNVLIKKLFLNLFANKSGMPIQENKKGKFFNCLKKGQSIKWEKRSNFHKINTSMKFWNFIKCFMLFWNLAKIGL